MPSSIQAMIVEDNRQLAESLRSFFAVKKEIDVVDIASDSLDAIERLKKHRLDLIILDLVMPRSDGFVLLEHLNTLQGKNRPEVLVLTSLGHGQFIRRACDLGAAYYMMKPFSMADLHERAKNIMSARDTSLTGTAQSYNGVDSIDLSVSALLAELGISQKLKGHRYLCEAVQLVIAQPDSIHKITKLLYPEIGKKYGCSPLAVERCIRHAIEAAHCSGKETQCDNRLMDDNSLETHKFSNGEFISFISSRLFDSIKRNAAE